MGEGETPFVQPDGLEREKTNDETRSIGEASALATPVVAPVPAEFVPAELNLEVVGYFDASYKRRYPGLERRGRKDGQVEITPTEKVVELPGRTIRFIPSAKYGYANTHDQDFYRALQAICEQRLERVEEARADGSKLIAFVLPQPLRFSNDELLRHSSREESARERRAIREWIKRNRAMGIEGKFRVADGRGHIVEAGAEPLFKKFFCVGDPIDGGEKADANYVWFADWFLNNFRYGYLKSIDVAFHRRLRMPIAKGLYPILDQGWYASKGNPYSKRYSELARVLALAPVSFPADLKKQLEPALEELRNQQYLKEWSYRRSSDDRDWIITFVAGPKFTWDQEARRKRRELADRVDEIESGDQAEQRVSLTAEEEYLVGQILQITKDEHSRPYYEKLVRELKPSARVYGLISETRDAVQTGKVKTTAARYFTDLAQRVLGRKGQPDRGRSVESA